MGSGQQQQHQQQQHTCLPLPYDDQVSGLPWKVAPAAAHQRIRGRLGQPHHKCMQGRFSLSRLCKILFSTLQSGLAPFHSYSYKKLHVLYCAVLYGHALEVVDRRGEARGASIGESSTLSTVSLSLRLQGVNFVSSM